MRIKTINIITVLSLITILTLQSVWLYNTYYLIRDSLVKETDSLLDEAVNAEAIIRFGMTPDGTEIRGADMKETNKILPEIVYLQEGLLNVGFDISLEKVDSIYLKLLSEHDINSTVVTTKINPETGDLLQTMQKVKLPRWGTIKTKIIPIRIDESQGIQAILTTPHWVIFERMALLIIATALMMVFVAYSIIYQIKIIIRQNKIAKVREDFSYAMIHDMKSPLSSILMGVRTLHSGKLDDKPEKKERHYQILEDEAIHLLALTDKVLTISKLEKEKIDLHKQEVLLKPMVDKLAEKFIAKAGKPVQFSTHFEVPSVYADAEYFYEVISNLIDNAIKYSKDSVQIDISSCLEGNDAVVKVKDNGIGISPKDQKIIFEKFERASAINRIRKGGATGFGLGLNYVFHIAEAHEGRVIVESIEDEFTEFIIYIPQIVEEL